jgi:hypothetical protein
VVLPISYVTEILDGVVHAAISDGELEGYGSSPPK